MNNFLDRFRSVKNTEECIKEMNDYSLNLIYSIESELMETISIYAENETGFYAATLNDYADFLKSMIKYEKDALIDSEVQFALRSVSVGNYSTLREEVRYAPEDAFECLFSDLREYTQKKNIDKENLNEDDLRASNLAVLDLADAMSEMKEQVFSENEKILEIIDKYNPKK